MGAWTMTDSLAGLLSEGGHLLTGRFLTSVMETRLSLFGNTPARSRTTTSSPPKRPPLTVTCNMLSFGSAGS